jgi:hypothetical protein
MHGTIIKIIVGVVTKILHITSLGFMKSLVTAMLPSADEFLNSNFIFII